MQLYPLRPRCAANIHRCVFKAVQHGVAQKVVKHTRHFIGVAFIRHGLRQFYPAGKALFCQGGLKLAGHLAQHQSKVYRGLFQLHMRKVETRDLEKLVCQIFQAQGLFQRNIRIARPHLGRKL